MTTTNERCIQNPMLDDAVYKQVCRERLAYLNELVDKCGRAKSLKTKTGLSADIFAARRWFEIEQVIIHQHEQSGHWWLVPTEVEREEMRQMEIDIELETLEREIARNRQILRSRMRSLRDGLTRAMEEVDDGRFLQRTGVVQGQGSEIDSLIAEVALKEEMLAKIKRLTGRLRKEREEREDAI